MAAVRRAILYWSSLAALGILCTVLAVLQYRWIGEISRAEAERSRASLQTSLQRFSREFNAELAAEARALFPPPHVIEAVGRERAYHDRYTSWVSTTHHAALFKYVGIAVPAGNDIHLYLISEAGVERGPWPESWSVMQEKIRNRLAGGPPPIAPEDSLFVEFPRFGPGRLPEQEWLVLELNRDYLVTKLLPDRLQRSFGPSFHAEVVQRRTGETLLEWPEPKQDYIRKPDATTRLFEFRPMRPGPESGHWELRIRSQFGPLEATVERARRRNLAVSALTLLLLITSVVVLLRLSRNAEQLAQSQLQFVAGVSHELRTPLTVIRTAAHNLRGRLANNPAQVERYGELIQEQSEKLTNLIDQVMSFASLQAGRLVRDKMPVHVADVVQNAVEAARPTGLQVDVQMPDRLPVVLADHLALTTAIRNLLDNARQHGSGTATLIVESNGNYVELRVRDQGPGIPEEERARIFEPFFRGRRALDDQVHGTGLGLNLVKSIVEAHGGGIEVRSEIGRGTEFLVRLPVAPRRPVDEAAHSAR